jgi:hypothetical protein
MPRGNVAVPAAPVVRLMVGSCSFACMRVPGGGSATAGSAAATTFGGGGLAGAGLAAGASVSVIGEYAQPCGVVVPRGTTAAISISSGCCLAAEGLPLSNRNKLLHECFG